MTVYSRAMTAPALRGYYAILDVRGPDLDLDRELARGEELLAARPCCLQLRAKQLGGRDLLALSRVLVAACRRAGVASCVNDRLDVALITGADMVHVGQDDLSLAPMSTQVLDQVAGRAGGLPGGGSIDPFAGPGAGRGGRRRRLHRFRTGVPHPQQAAARSGGGDRGATPRWWRRFQCRWWRLAASPASNWPRWLPAGWRRRR